MMIDDHRPTVMRVKSQTENNFALKHLEQQHEHQINIAIKVMSQHAIQKQNVVFGRTGQVQRFSR